MRNLGTAAMAATMAWSSAVQASSVQPSSVQPSSVQPSSVQPPQRAASKDLVWVWYRGGEGCPEGGAFIGLLRGLGRAASLARVGDSVDFVVTVAYGDHGSSGRLERQNSERTVTIRDVAAATCEEVAEVLALSLDLAVQPLAEPQPAASPPPSVSDGWEERLGAQLTLETGLARAVLPGAALFVDLGPARHGGSLRLSLRGAYGERTAAVVVNMGLLASRVEACWSWAVGDVALGPCGGVEIGLVVAESSDDGARTDAGLWSSAAGHVRGSWQLGRFVALEAQSGLLVPFVRYQFSAQTGDEVTGSALLGLEAALGFSIRF